MNPLCRQHKAQSFFLSFTNPGKRRIYFSFFFSLFTPWLIFLFFIADNRSEESFLSLDRPNHEKSISSNIISGGSNCNDITNEEFDLSSTGWQLYVAPGNSGTLNINSSSQLSGTNSAQVDIVSTTGTDLNVQVYQNGIPIFAGQEYAFSFLAKSSIVRTINVSVRSNQAPWNIYYSENIVISTTAGGYGNFTFTAPLTDENATISFNLGTTTGAVYIDQIEFFNTSCFHIISGTVFNDIDVDGSYSNSENGQPGVKIDLYKDVNQDGLYDLDDTFLESVTTDSNGAC